MDFISAAYRANATEAPIKETLAAAMVKLSRVYRDSILFDPFCGSGTILVEGAMYAMHLAPGLRRRFAAERWDQICTGVAERAGKGPGPDSKGCCFYRLWI